MMVVQENENISYAELSSEDYITAVQRGNRIETATLKEYAKTGNFEALGPAVVVKLRQNAKTACRLLLQMEREGVDDRSVMDDCLDTMPASLKKFMAAFLGHVNPEREELQACRFLREVFMGCAGQQQLKRYASMVHCYPELLLETAELFLKEGHYVMALEMYQAVPETAITERERCLAVGTCAYYSSRFELAKENLRRAGELGDNSPEISVFLRWIEDSEAKHR